MASEKTDYWGRKKTKNRKKGDVYGKKKVGGGTGERGVALFVQWGLGAASFKKKRGGEQVREKDSD